jgi:hypothetical protein
MNTVNGEIWQAAEYKLARIWLSPSAPEFRELRQRTDTLINGKATRRAVAALLCFSM